jgi:hypothetical protein
VSDRDRLFRIIVLGGIGMLGVGAHTVGCGETTSSSPADAGASSSSSGSMPTEGCCGMPPPLPEGGDVHFSDDAAPEADGDVSDAPLDGRDGAEPTDAMSTSEDARED